MSQEVELLLLWKAETDMAVLVEDDAGHSTWLPKSQIDIEEGCEIGQQTNFLIPEWLGIEKGLV